MGGFANRDGQPSAVAGTTQDLRHQIFYEQECRAFAAGCSRFIEPLPDGRVRRRATGEEFDSINDALEAVAGVLLTDCAWWCLYRPMP